jgi:glycosyltransferase involved in cell wall biosynthesis
MCESVVILPVYGTAPFVADALDSDVGQTFGDYEIIVVNDGSPDSQLFEKLLQPFRQRITYIVQENRGLAAARNTGVRSSTARYVAMLDSDDRWHPEYLASQLSVLEAHPDFDVVTTEERAALGAQRETVIAKLNLAEGKQAFIERDALIAIANLTVAARYTGSWKLWIVIAMLKIAPGSLLRLYQLREQRSPFRFS